MKVGDKCIQRSLVFFNILCFIIGLIILSIGIWTAVDRIFLSDIIGTYLYSAASYLVISTGAIILIVAFIGGFGACMKMRFLLIVYFGLLLVIFLCLVIASILAVVFRGEIESTMRSSMRDSLINLYGVDVHRNSENSAVTMSWDETQWRFECCAVDDAVDWDYRVYRQSNWFAQTQEPKPVESYRFVPESCCRRIYVRGDLQYQNVDGCQKPLLPIPPKGDSSFGENEAFNKQGCFSKGYDLVMEQAGIILAVGFTFAFALILGMVLAICLYRTIPSVEAVPDKDNDSL